MDYYYGTKEKTKIYFIKFSSVNMQKFFFISFHLNFITINCSQFFICFPGFRNPFLTFLMWKKSDRVWSE